MELHFETCSRSQSLITYSHTVLEYLITSYKVKELGSGHEHRQS